MRKWRISREGWDFPHRFDRCQTGGERRRTTDCPSSTTASSNNKPPMGVILFCIENGRFWWILSSFIYRHYHMAAFGWFSFSRGFPTSPAKMLCSGLGFQSFQKSPKVLGPFGPMGGISISGNPNSWATWLQSLVAIQRGARSFSYQPWFAIAYVCCHIYRNTESVVDCVYFLVLVISISRCNIN